MSHTCDVPAATGDKPIRWRCPGCGKRWDFDPTKDPNPFFGHRDRAGREVGLWRWLTT